MKSSNQRQALVPVHVEVCLVDASPAKVANVKHHVRQFLESRSVFLRDGPVDCSSDQILASHLKYLTICLPERAKTNDHIEKKLVGMQSSYTSEVTLSQCTTWRC
jgi:hypothetical protein